MGRFELAMTLRVRRMVMMGRSVEVPGDELCSQLTVILAALAQGESVVKNFLPNHRGLATLEILRQLGVKIEALRTGPWGPMDLQITGQKMCFPAREDDLDLRELGVGQPLLLGELTGQEAGFPVVVDTSTSDVLLALGLRRGDEVDGFEGTDSERIAAKAEVGGAFLLAGLRAEGRTTVRVGPGVPDHVARLLADFGVRARQTAGEVSLLGGQVPVGRVSQVPGDFSLAALWLVAAAAKAESSLRIGQVGLNPTRTTLLKVLLRMGAHFRDHEGAAEGREPIGDLVVEGRALKGTTLLAEEVPFLREEIPILAIAGALAQGRMVLRNLAELRKGEKDWVEILVRNLRLLGAEVEEFEDGLEIHGGRPLGGAVIDCDGVHRIAMAFAIAGMFISEGAVEITDSEGIAALYPGFPEALKSMRTGGRVKLS